MQSEQHYSTLHVGYNDIQMPDERHGKQLLFRAH